MNSEFQQKWVVPDNTILIIPENEIFNDVPSKVITNLKGQVKRDWFIPHAYLCPPLVLGNEHGFVLKSLYNFKVIWMGGDLQTDVIVEHLDDNYHTEQHQVISSHFGMGTFTIQNRFTIRTPPGINLLTINPPNIFKHGLYHMTGCVEADNLRRDFTYNIRITAPNEWITINKGDIIGCILPIPRRFIDKFELKMANEVLTDSQIRLEQDTSQLFGIERSVIDKNKPKQAGRRYFKGEDVYGNKFGQHQTRLDR